MRGDLTVRKTKTASGATAVQVVRNIGKRREILHHIGSAHDEQSLAMLLSEAEQFAERHRLQPSLFAQDKPAPAIVNLDEMTLVSVTHRFARDALRACSRLCKLGWLEDMYLDLALMRIIEPASKIQTLDMLEEYFGIRYATRTMRRRLDELLDHQEGIELATIQTAREEFNELFSLVLYDVTTLYFESFKEYDFQSTGFSKDNKPQQPQIVIGLITTRCGFPVMHEVFEGKTFEGRTMLKILERFQQRMGSHCKPVIVADAAMLSTENMASLDQQGYRFIVGARLANHSKTFIDQIHTQTPRIDETTVRLEHTLKKDKLTVEVSVVCQFSTARYKKDKRELDKQLSRAMLLLERNEPGRRARFVKKADGADHFQLDVELKAKAEKLLGIKGYVTNIAQAELSDQEIVKYYHDLWHVEQAFRMSKSDLQARPIYHRNEVAIKSHVLICFMALMMGKYLELKTGMSLKRIRKTLWRVHEAHLRDERTGKVYIKRTGINNPQIDAIIKALQPEFPH